MLAGHILEHDEHDHSSFPQTPTPELKLATQKTLNCAPWFRGRNGELVTLVFDEVTESGSCRRKSQNDLEPGFR